MATIYRNAGSEPLEIRGVLRLEVGQITPPIEIMGFAPEATSLEAAKARGLAVLAETDLLPPPAPSPDGTVPQFLGLVVGEGPAVDAGEVIEVTGPAEAISVSGHSLARFPARHENQTRFLYSPAALAVGARFKALVGPVEMYVGGEVTYEIRPFVAA